MADTMADTVAAPSPEPIVQIATGFMAAKQLFAASELGMFAVLAARPLPVGELAARLGIGERPCRIIADAMAGLGLLTRAEKGYRNTDAAAAYLSGRSGPLDLRPYLAFWDAISYPHWQSYAEAARAGEPAPLDLRGERRNVFFAGVQAYNGAHALMLAQHYDFGAHERILDLAGLSGAFLTAAIDRHPGLRGTFFAEPGMVDFARPGLDPDHVTVVAADPFTDPLPDGHDAVLLEHVVHRYDAARNRALLERARAAVRPGARLLILDFFLGGDRPLDALLAGEYLVIDGTVVHPEDEVRSWVAETGWRWVETLALPGSPRVLIADAI